MIQGGLTAKQKAILVSVAESTSMVDATMRNLDELTRLLETAGGETFATIIQVKEHLDPRTCIGSGKVDEIKTLCEQNDIHLVVFDFELSPSQIRNLEDALGDVDVIDRSMLILDIFALHAVTAEGKLQVELAQLKYTAPRLIGKGKDLSRQEGRIGTRGPGESQLETDRRHLKERLYALEKQLKDMQQKRLVMRASRDRSGIPKVGIVGYTNAGKSTLLNALTDAGVLSEDKLFATLDATTRRMVLPNGEPILLTDTVGFIRKLPHHLIKAFQSTLDEVTYSDILLVVSDASDPEIDEHLEVTAELIQQLGAAEKPVIYVFNKCDLLEAWPEDTVEDDTYRVFVSAAEGRGLEQFCHVLEDVIAQTKRTVSLLIPYTDQGKLNLLYQNAQVLNVEYQDDGIMVQAKMDNKAYGQFKMYVRTQ